MRKLVSSLGVFILFTVFSFVFYISTTHKQQQVNKLQITQIEKQIALDLPLLDLSNKLLKHSGNKASLQHYIQTVNAQIQGTGIQVISIVPKH